MTLETLSRPSPMGEANRPSSDRYQLRPASQILVDVFEQSGGTATKSQLLDKLKPNTNPSSNPSYLRMMVSRARKELEEKQGKTIRFVWGSNPRYEMVDDAALVLPNGTRVQIRGHKQKEILRLFIENFNKDITNNDAYPNANSKGNLPNKVRQLRKILPKEYKITSKTDVEGVTHYRLGEDSSKVKLPNGEVIEGLTQHEHAVLSFFINYNLPIYMKQLTDHFYPDVNYNVARSRIRVRIQNLKKVLSSGDADIVLATKYHTPNAAYIFSTKETDEKTDYPFAKADDQFINLKIEQTTNLLEAQKGNRALTLTDEVNEKLNTELQQLKDEMTLRKKIEERLKKGKEWYQNQARHEINNKDLPEIKEEIEYPSIVTLTRIRYRYNGRGLPSEVLDKAGQEALEKAKERFNPENGFSLEEYAEFWIRGAMGNMLLYNSPEAPETERHGLALPDDSIKSFKKDFTIALVDLSSRRRYPENFLSSYESRALDIRFGITGKNPGSSEDVAYEFDSSIPWADRLAKSAIEKIKNSPHAPILAKYFSS